MLKYTRLFGIKQNSKYSYIQNQCIKNENGQVSAVMFFSIQGSFTRATKEESIIPYFRYFWAVGLPWPWCQSTCKAVKTLKQLDWESSPLDSDRMQINKWFRHKSWITTYLFIYILFLKPVIWITAKSVFLSGLFSFYTLRWIYSWTTIL